MVRQVALCDTVWQVMLHSTGMGSPGRAIRTL